MIPSDIKWDPNATPPQFTDNGDQVIEKGTHLRIKIMGTRSDVGSMFAIGSIKEDFLGFVGIFVVIPTSTYSVAGLSKRMSSIIQSPAFAASPRRKPLPLITSKMYSERLYGKTLVLTAGGVPTLLKERCGL